MSLDSQSPLFSSADSEFMIRREQIITNDELVENMELLTPRVTNCFEHTKWVSQYMLNKVIATKTPDECFDAVQFVINYPPSEVNAFRAYQSSYLRKLFKDHSTDSKFQYEALRILLIKLQYDDLGVINILKDGARVTGHIAGRPAWPDETLEPSLDKSTMLDINKGLHSKFLRKEDITTKNKDAIVAVWEETLREVEEGFLQGPYRTVQEIQTKLGCSKVALNRRFPGPKNRPCDDGRSSFVNKTYGTDKRLKLATIRHFSALFRFFCDRSKIKLWKRDHRKAYKQIPVNEEDLDVCVVCVPNGDGDIFLFISTVLPFGFTAAVTAYNRVSQCLVFVMNAFFRTPMLGYFDDFAGIEGEATVQSSFDSFGLLNELVGFVLKVEKDIPPTTQIDLLGFEVVVKPACLSVRITAKRCEKLLGLLAVLGAAGLEWKELERLVGELNFGLGGFFEQAGRNFLAPLYMRLNPYERRFCSDNFLEWAVAGLSDTLRSAPPKILKSMSPRDVALIYTDASSLGLGFVALNLLEAGPVFGSHQFTQKNIKSFKKFVTKQGFKLRNLINWQEMAAVGVAFFALRRALWHRHCIVFIDNVAVEKLLKKNYSRNVSLSVGAGLLNRFFVKWDIQVTFCRVTSALNVADEPSRVFEEFPVMSVMGASRIPVTMTYLSRWLTASEAIGAARCGGGSGAGGRADEAGLSAGRGNDSEEY